MSNTTIQLRKSGQTGNTPADLAHGELAINYADGKLFYKNGVGIKSIENQKTFSTINANNSLVIATSPTDILSLVAGSNILLDTNTTTKTITISVPGGSSIDTLARELAQAAYDEANTQNVINQTQNTWITNTNTFAQAAYGAANTAASNTVYLQLVNNLQNTNITSADTLATAAYSQANNASGNTVALQAVNTLQNTNITAVNTFAQAAYNQANTTPTQLQTAGIRTNASYFPLFVDSNNAVLTAESIYSTGAGITINPSTNTITATTFSGGLNGSVVGAIGSFSQYVDLTGDDDYIEWGASNDARMMYNGPANTINLQLYSDVISFKVVDNANTADRFIFYKANGDLRLVSGNLIFSDGTVQRTEALTAAQAAFNSANAGVTLATAAFGTANTAAGNTVALQAQMSTTNTNVAAVNTFAFMASFTANSGWTAANSGVSLATAAFGAANTAAGNTVALQAQMNTTNTNITSVNTFTQAAFNKANNALANTTGIFNGTLSVTGTLASLQSAGDEGGQIDLAKAVTNTSLVTGVSIDVFQNRLRIFETGGTNRGVFIDLANGAGTGVSTNLISGGDTIAFAAYAQANNASGNTVALQAQMSTTNTNVAAVNTFTQAAFNSANAGVTLAQSAYNTANLKFNTTGGTITGSVTIQNNLVVQGNLSVLGNSTTISTSSLAISDPLIFLANGNIVTDTVDVGVIGHYGGPSGETHTGIFRDPNLKEWIIFQGYTTQIQSNNLINIADPSFAYANLYANVVKSNLISTYAVVNGLNVFSTMSSAFASANAGVTLATAAYGAANTAAGNTVALQAQMTTTNTNITSVNTFAGSAFNSANAGVTLATASYAQANNASGNTVALQAVNNLQNTNITSVNTFAGSAFNSANAGVTLATAAYAQANSASGNTIALQAQMSTTNTNITSVNTFAGSAFNSANAGVTLATAAYAQANNASGNTVALQAQMNTTNTNVAAVNTFAQAGFNKANGAVQIGFTTISANSVSITPASNADTLTISAGNNVTISACNTTKTITIGSTGGGSGTTTTVLTDVRRTVATAGQTLFSVPIYEIGSNTIRIFINGVRQNNIIDYTETSTSTITLVDPAAANDNVVFEVTAFDTTLTPNQNTWINNTDTLARAAYNQANTTPSTINTRGIQTNASYFPIFVDANAAIATAESLFSHGSLTYNPSTGTCSATIFSATSDESLKENIKTIEDPINIIRQLRGVTYTWKNTKEESIGLIAQEVEKVLPIVIRESGDKKTIDYPNMIGLLVEAIKEQQKQIDELKRKIDGTSN